MRKQTVLILCTGNSARSQMAEGLWRYDGADRFEVFSAGTRPSIVRPEAIAVMLEIGIDISRHRSKSVDEFVGRQLDLVVTVCGHADKSCPSLPNASRRVHWPFEDPAAVIGTDSVRLEAFRKVRDQIRGRVRDFLSG